MTASVIAFFSLGLLAACQSGSPATNNAANQPVDKSAVNANQTETKPSPSETPAKKTETDHETTGSLATPTDAYKTAYAARQKKDVGALKTAISKDMLEFFGMIGDDEKKTADDMLKELVEKPQGPSNDIRNEKITGNTATLEYLDETGKWKEMDFVKEDGGWKLTIAKGNPTDTGKKGK